VLLLIRVQHDSCCAHSRSASLAAEFDPYFNYRVTQFLTKEGFYETWNWFDTRTWYPLGRVVGGTMYPVRVVNTHHLLDVNNRQYSTDVTETIYQPNFVTGKTHALFRAAWTLYCPGPEWCSRSIASQFTAHKILDNVIRRICTAFAPYCIWALRSLHQLQWSRRADLGSGWLTFLGRDEASNEITCLQGLIWTAGTMYKILHALNIPIHVQEVLTYPSFRTRMHVPLALCVTTESTSVSCTP
jgi:hypothetical protein